MKGEDNVKSCCYLSQPAVRRHEDTCGSTRGGCSRVWSGSQDHFLITPMLDGAKENIKVIGQSEDYFKGKILTADSNYHDPINLKKCDEEKLDAYIPDKDFRKKDPRFTTQERHRPRRIKKFTWKDFRHNESRDEYVCPQGKVLNLDSKKVEKDGVIYRRYANERWKELQGLRGEEQML